MKALTLYPTWAVLIMLEHKRLETRGWQTTHRGALAITASAKISDDDRACFDRPIYQRVLAPAGYKRLEDLPRGMVLCTALLTNIFTTAEVRDSISEEEKEFGNYDEGRFAWKLEGVEKIEPHLRCRGNRMLWDVDLTALREGRMPDKLVKKIKARPAPDNKQHFLWNE